MSILSNFPCLQNWDTKHWSEYVSRLELETRICYVAGEKTGHFELEKKGDGNIEIGYLGQKSIASYLILVYTVIN